MFTTTRAIMRPRRLRSSMNRVAIMAPLGSTIPGGRRSMRRRPARWRSAGRRQVAVLIGLPPVGW